MPETNNPHKADFQKKSVEQPMLDSSLRDRLNKPVLETTIPVAGNSPSAGFFKQNRIYIFAIILGLAVIGGLAFLAFRPAPPAPPKEANLSLEIDAPESLPSGAETLYKINLKNNDSQTLTGVELEVTYPEGFIYLGGTPKAQNLSGSVFSLDSIRQGETATFIIKVKASGAVGDEKKLAAKAYYKYNNYNSAFSLSGSHVLRLSAPDIALELTGPPNTTSQQLVVYNLKYQNSSNEDIKSARVKMEYPAGFEFSSSDPQPDIGNDTWSLPALTKGGSGNISVRGSFRAALPGESKTVLASFLVQGGNGQFSPQASAQTTTQMASLPLLVSHQLSSDHPAEFVKPGDTLSFSVDYQNNNNTAVTGVNIIVSLDPKVLDLTSIRAEGAQISGSTITWNASSVSQLENLSPSESGHLAYSVRLKNPATKDSSRNLTVSSNIKIKAREYDDFFPGNTVSLKVSSPAGIDSRVDYVSGARPPMVGKDTFYKITITLFNSSNDFSDGTAAMFIPLGSGGYQNAVNSQESGKVEFDQTTGKLSWNFGVLPAHTGKFTPPRVLQFNVKLNPSASQAYSSPVLVKDITAVAKDSFTGQEISLNADNLTTSDAAGDSYGGGSVQP